MCHSTFARAVNSLQSVSEFQPFADVLGHTLALSAPCHAPADAAKTLRRHRGRDRRRCGHTSRVDPEAATQGGLVGPCSALDVLALVRSACCTASSSHGHEVVVAYTSQRRSGQVFAHRRSGQVLASPQVRPSVSCHHSCRLQSGA